MAAFSLSQRARDAADQPISYLMAEALRNPGLISLAAGFVDSQSLPAAATARHMAELLAEPAAARAALQYGTTQGEPRLRQLLFEHLAKLDGVPIDRMPGSADDIVVTTGSQQLLHVLADLLVDPGDIVICGWPSYFVFTGALTAFGAATRAVDLDHAGMAPEALEATLRQLQHGGLLPRVKIVYVCSYHQNPTGLTLGEDRRPRILDIVRRFSDLAGHRILLVEDAAYRELTYDGTPPPSIRRYDTTGDHVALLQTFSKPFAPGLKAGYGLLPTGLVEHAILNKGGRDFGSSNLCQHLLGRVIASGDFDRHVQTLRGVYRAKRDAMLAALDRGFAGVEGVSWTRPTGGLYVWLTLPQAIDTGRHGPLFAHALRAGVLFVPGEYCYPPDPTRTVPRSTIRLSFGVTDPAGIADGIERLASAVRAVLP
jgi:2-aminoadipate transaminase